MSERDDFGSYQPLTYFQLMEISLRELLVEKGVLSEQAVSDAVEEMQRRGPDTGARVVARAWADPGFGRLLLENGTRACEAMGIEVPATRLVVVENTPQVHNMIVCTLCSCYPRMLLGIPPDWYKSRNYRSRAVREPRAVRETWPGDRALGARISGNDWMEGGAGPEDAIAFARELKALGYHYVCVSSGAMVPQARIPIGPGYQVGLAAQVRKAVPIAVRAVGLIAHPDQAEAIVASGQADMVALARGMLDDPRWVWHAAEHFGVKIDYPPQYARCRSDLWPGATLARPEGKAKAAA